MFSFLDLDFLVDFSKIQKHGTIFRAQCTTFRRLVHCVHFVNCISESFIQICTTVILHQDWESAKLKHPTEGSKKTHKIEIN